MTGQVQILGIREGQGAEAFLGKLWRFDSVKDLFADIKRKQESEGTVTFMDTIPPSDRWNLYYTVCAVKEGKGRIFVKQSVIPFDIDDVDREQRPQVVASILETLNVKPTDVAIVYSGNGIQILVQTKEEWNSKDYFKVHKPYYDMICDNIDADLKAKGLTGHTDKVVWSPSRLMRLPWTTNKKPDKPDTLAELVQGNMTPIEWNWVKTMDIQFPELHPDDLIHPNAVMRMPKPDTKAVQKECGFLKHSYDNQETLSEPQWYAMLSIVARLENGEKLAHEYSSKHSGYDPVEVDRKLEQATTVTGPRTCENINTLWDGCADCPHYKKIASPITIRGAEYMVTETTGFWNVTEKKNGEIKRTTINYSDLKKYYNKLHPHVSDIQTNLIYTYQDNYWQQTEKIEIKAFVEDNVVPVPEKDMQREEFYKKMLVTNRVRDTFFETNGLVNCLNGVVDVKNSTLIPHDKDYGMRYILPFKYDPSAGCPKWLKFLDQVTLGRQGLKDALQEFIGYTLSFDDPRNGQKALILVGSGANGKSVLMEVVRELIGRGNATSVNLKDAFASDEKRYGMLDKVANITEESPDGLLKGSDTFKNMVSGGDMSVRKLYHGTFNAKYMGKLLLACNELPAIYDSSNGTMRRLIVIPFDYRVKQEDRNPNIHNDLKEELSGIFNWALQGYSRLLDNKYEFTESMDTLKALQHTKVEGSFLKDFIEDSCIIGDEELYTASSELYDAWAQEAVLSQRSTITRAKFGTELKSVMRILLNNPDYSGTRKRVNGDVVRGYTHIELKEPNDSTY